MWTTSAGGIPWRFSVFKNPGTRVRHHQRRNPRAGATVAQRPSAARSDPQTDRAHRGAEAASDPADREGAAAPGLRRPQHHLRGAHQGPGSGRGTPGARSRGTGAAADRHHHLCLLHRLHDAPADRMAHRRDGLPAGDATDADRPTRLRSRRRSHQPGTRLLHGVPRRQRARRRLRVLLAVLPAHRSGRGVAAVQRPVRRRNRRGRDPGQRWHRSPPGTQRLVHHPEHRGLDLLRGPVHRFPLPARQARARDHGATRPGAAGRRGTAPMERRRRWTSTSSTRAVRASWTT